MRVGHGRRATVIFERRLHLVQLVEHRAHVVVRELMCRDRSEGKLVVALGAFQVAFELAEPADVDVGVGIARIESDRAIVCVRGLVGINLFQVQAEVVPIVAVEFVELLRFDQIALGQLCDIARQFADGEIEVPLTGLDVPDRLLVAHHHVVAVREDAHRGQ